MKEREQVGGDHYRSPEGIPEHWDIAWALDWDFYQYQITKYIWRWKQKGGLPDLKKAQHFLKKYIEVIEGQPKNFDTGEPQSRGYVDQDCQSGPARPTSADAPPVAPARGEFPPVIHIFEDGDLVSYYRKE